MPLAGSTPGSANGIFLYHLMILETSKIRTTDRPADGVSTLHPPRGQRALDLIIAIPLLILLLPVFAVTLIWIKCSSRGPIFFVQRRVGQNERTFLIFKFRTMVINAEDMGAQITIGRDPRITRCGYFLRKFKLDELPQLFNVIKGEMSLVGPRPEVPRYVEQYSDEQRQILLLRPGITSPASINFKNESELLAAHPDPEQFYQSELVPAKIRQDLEYARRATIWSDCRVILNTLLRVLR
jgi:lipopolysaccharide/colanic/teichoic acid biosynthesis glycosyltransferase